MLMEMWVLGHLTVKCGMAKNIKNLNGLQFGQMGTNSATAG